VEEKEIVFEKIPESYSIISAVKLRAFATGRVVKIS